MLICGAGRLWEFVMDWMVVVVMGYLSMVGYSAWTTVEGIR